VNRVIQWLDIDPTFDGDWVAWSTLRTYAYVPGLRAMLNPISPLNYGRIAHVASSFQDDIHQSRSYHGLIKHENLTIEQIKILVGTNTSESGRPKPVRLDKALLGMYGINAELLRQGQQEIHPKIVLSAFNIRGVSKRFNELNRDDKESVKVDLAIALNQSNQVASDFLKGNKVSIDSAVRGHEYLSSRREFKRSLPAALEDCLETPSQRHTPATQHEDFTRGRLEELPAPFRRPAPESATAERQPKASRGRE